MNDLNFIFLQMLVPATNDIQSFLNCHSPLAMKTILVIQKPDNLQTHWVPILTVIHDHIDASIQGRMKDSN